MYIKAIIFPPPVEGDPFGWTSRILRARYDEMPGEWVPLVDYERQARAVEQMFGEPVLEVRQVVADTWYVLEILPAV